MGKWVIAYVLCPAITCGILWIRQGRFLAYDPQIFGALVLGPLGPLIALFTPKSLLTSKKEFEGK
jgi:hypothetical protein